MATYQEFSAKIKAKYPTYQDVDDMVLAKRVVEKYPVYADKVSFEGGDVSLETMPEVKTETTPLQAAGQEVTKLFKPQEIIKKLQTPEAMGVGQGVLQGATFGYGTPILRKIIESTTGSSTKQVRPPTTKESVVGGALGATALAPTGIYSLLGKGSLPSQIAKGATAGYSYNPSDTEIVPLNDMRRAVGTALGGVAPVAIRGGQAAWGATFGRGGVLKNIRKALHKPLKEAGEVLEDRINQIDDAMTSKGELVDITDTVSDIRRQMVDIPDVRSAVAKSPKLRKLVITEYPTPDTKIPFSTAQEIKRELSGTTKMKGLLSGSRQASPMEQEAKEMVYKLRADMLKAKPEFAKDLKNYSKVAKDWDLVKRGMKTSKTEPFLFSKTSGMGETETKEAIKRLSPAMYRKMKGIRNLMGGTKLAGKLAPYAAVGTTGYLLRDLLR